MALLHLNIFHYYLGPMSFAIVSMVRGLDQSFTTWVEHHINQGCTKFYLIFDSPDEDRLSIKRVKALASNTVEIVIIENTVQHREKR